MMTKKIIVDGSIYEFTPMEGETLLELILRLKIPLNHNCGGMGTCGTCRIFFTHGCEFLPKPNEVEQEMIHDRGFSKNERLACQLELDQLKSLSLEVKIPDAKRKKKLS